MKAGVSKGLITALVVLGLLLPGLPILAEDRAGMFQPEAGLSSDPLSDSLARDARELRANADEDGNVVVVVKLQGTALLGVQQERVVEELKGHAVHSQKSVLEFLETRGATVLNTFWLTNALLARVPEGLLLPLATQPGVERLFPNFEVSVPQPREYEALGDAGPDWYVGEVTQGLHNIGAPGVWDMGITGEGVRVAVLDTGVDMTHPDLSDRMHTDDPGDPAYPGGWIEFDWAGHRVPESVPHDTGWHGTHVSGTVLGGNNLYGYLHIGVAPDAILMHALVLPDGSGTFAQVIAGMQWCVFPLDQYGLPAGESADVVNMSLGAGGYHDVMRTMVEHMRATGLVVIASIGNDYEGTSGSPGNVHAAFGIGATDGLDFVAGFSGGEEMYWPASHPDPYIKPDFSAPGVLVASAQPGGWALASGTSMAAPHVAGTVALMLQADPMLEVADIYDILKNTGVWYDRYYFDRPCTRYGWGRINAYDAVSAVMFESGIEGTVTDDDTGDPIEGAEVYVPETGSVRFTDDSGYYRFHLSEGAYNVTTERFGYHGDTAIDVVVAEGGFAVQDFALEPMPTGFIDGTVTDGETEMPIGGATITVLGTPLSHVTGGDGLYFMEAPIGTYDVMASAVLHVDSVALNVTVPEEGTVIVDFVLQPARVAVLGDFNSQLTDLLIANGIWAHQRGWDIITDIAHYDAVAVNRPYDPGEETFLAFLDAASDNKVGVVFTSSWPVELEPYGISLLQRHLGDPIAQDHSWADGDVHYIVTEEHHILQGWHEGDTITIIDSGDWDYAWFWGYSGYTIADVGSEYAGIQGNAVALNAYGDSLHVLLAGLAPQYWTNLNHWTEDAKTIFVRGILVAGGHIELDLVAITTELPPAVVGEEYEATLKAMGGTKPYTWDIVGGGLPPGLVFDQGAGIISGTPTEAGTFAFTAEVTDDAQTAATREFIIAVIEWTEFINDPVGDQFYGYGPDIVGVDFHRDEQTIRFRVRTAEPIDYYDVVNYTFLDLDLDPSTGSAPAFAGMPINDIGVDAIAVIHPAYLMTAVESPVLVPTIGYELQFAAEPSQASPSGLWGGVFLWDPDIGDFSFAGYLVVFADTHSLSFAIPLDMIHDDGTMGVVNSIGQPVDYDFEPTDVAPNEGHGITGEGPDLVISDKCKEWVDEGEGTYTVHYVVRNKGNMAAPAGHETSLSVGGILLETKAVPIELGPGEEHQDSFDAIVSITLPADEVTVCSDFYDVVDELSEGNNCLTNTVWLEAAWTEFITDLEGDQFDGYGPDIVGLDYHRTEETVYFRVRTAEPIDYYDIVNYMFLDLDLDPSTGFVSPDPEMPTNDIGVDAVAAIFPGYYYYGMMEERLSLPMAIAGDQRQPQTEQAQAASAGLWGEVRLWDPYYEEFHHAGQFAVFTDSNHFWFAIPLDMLDDDGIMGVVNLIGDYWDWLTDVAPNEGHGVTLPPANPVRILPGAVLPGEEFEVTVTFTSPADGCNAIGLADVAPAGWTTSVNTAWTAPIANVAHKPADEEAAYIWFEPYDEGVEFTAVYRVQVPPGTAPGKYVFPGGRLEYYILGTGPHVAPIVGDFEVEVASVVISGDIRDVNCDILPGVTVTLYSNGTEIASTVSDDHGHYMLAVPGPGEYTVVAGKDGFRDGEQSIPIDELTTYTVDFVGAHGLIPNAPNMSYVLACINLWQFGEPPCKLTMSTVLAVMNAWQFPVQASRLMAEGGPDTEFA